MVLQSQLIGTLQRVDAGNKKLRQLTKMSFFTHMVVDNESIEESGHSWANYNNNRPKSNFFEAQTDRPNETTDHTSVEDGEGGKNHVDLPTKRKFLSHFPSFKRAHTPTSSETITEMPPPPPKTPTNDGFSLATNVNLASINNLSKSDTLISLQKCQQAQFPNSVSQVESTADKLTCISETGLHSSNLASKQDSEIVHPDEGLILGTITRTETWQEVTCLRSIVSEEIEAVKGHHRPMKTAAKRKAFWEEKEKRTRESLQQIREMKEAVISMEKEDIQQLKSIKEMEVQVLEQDITKLNKDISNTVRDATKAMEKLQSLIKCIDE